MALFCLMVASAFAMFAELLVWLAEPARSFGPHFEGAQFSVSGLSDTGPFSVCVSAGTARPSRSAMATSPVARTMENFMETLLSGDREQRAAPVITTPERGVQPEADADPERKSRPASSRDRDPTRA